MSRLWISAPLLLPAVFQIGLRVPPRNGGGKLTVDRGALVAELGPLSRALSKTKRYTHTAKRVTLVSARLLPPWMNTTWVLRDGESTVYAVTWIGARTPLRTALLAAGFEIDEVRTWFTQRPGPRSVTRTMLGLKDN